MECGHNPYVGRLDLGGVLGGILCVWICGALWVCLCYLVYRVCVEVVWSLSC